MASFGRFDPTVLGWMVSAHGLEPGDDVMVTKLAQLLALRHHNKEGASTAHVPTTPAKRGRNHDGASDAPDASDCAVVKK